MELVTVGVMTMVVFGVFASISSFVRHLMLSQDKKLNDEAQKKALMQEARELEQIRSQMESIKRFDAHYRILEENVEGIRYLDEKIEATIAKKMALIIRFSELSLKESSSVFTEGPNPERYVLHEALKREIDIELFQYNTEIEALQARRASLWQSKQELQEHLLKEESARNQELDKLYLKHSAILSKIYHRHDKVQAQIAHDNIKATSESYKISLIGPLKYWVDYFKSTYLANSANAAIFEAEKERRAEIKRFQDELNVDFDDEMETQNAPKTSLPVHVNEVLI